MQPEKEIVQYIYADRIDEPADAMRTDLDREGLWDLAEDIKKNGLINPITVRPVGDRFEVVAGHRRFNACKFAGIVKIPCVVRNLNDSQLFSVMASENLVREDVDPVDEGIFFLRVMEKTGQTISDLCKTVRRSEQYINDRLTIAQMPDYLQDALKQKKVSIGVAMRLARIPDEGLKKSWTYRATIEGVSITTAEYWLAQANTLHAAALAENKTIDEFIAPPTPEPVRFRCAIDGDMYPPEEMTVVHVHNSNWPILEEVRRQIRSAPPEIVPEHVGGELHAPSTER